MEFFLNHSKNYLCWSSALINSVSTMSMPRESPVSRVNFSLLDNIYILQLANYLYLSTLVHPNHSTGGSLPILWRVRFLLNVHFIIRLKQKIRGRGLIKQFITAKIILKKFLQSEQYLRNVFKACFFVAVSPYLYEWNNRNVTITIKKLHITIIHLLLCTFLFFLTMDTKWTQREPKINEIILSLPRRNTKHILKVWCSIQAILCFL